jgi:hypothetical protein
MISFGRLSMMCKAYGVEPFAIEIATRVMNLVCNIAKFPEGKRTSNLAAGAVLAAWKTRWDPRQCRGH